MPELPDVTLYVAHLARRLVGQTLESSRVISPNLLRTAEPSLETAHGRCVVRVRRLGKRIVIELEGPLFLVFHLMIAGRFHWQDAGDPGRGRKGLATFQFTSGTLSITEVSRKQSQWEQMARLLAGLACQEMDVQFGRGSRARAAKKGCRVS